MALGYVLMLFRCCTVNLQLRKQPGCLRRWALRSLVLCQKGTIKIILCDYHSPFILSVLANELSSIAFVIGSWLLHIRELALWLHSSFSLSDFVLPSSVQLLPAEPSVSFYSPPANRGSANPTNSSSWNTSIFHCRYPCLSSGCWHLLMHFNSLHAGLPYFSLNPILVSHFQDI